MVQPMFRVPPSPRLFTSHERYLQDLRRLMQEAVRQTQKFDARWNELNDSFNEKIEEENRVRRESGRPLHTVTSVADQKSNWLALSDAFAAGQWWRGKATYLASVIQAEIAMRREGL